ncbi:MAG: hypothetical protein ACTSRS_07490 [Candidatus Helarchaeota archaeon]
MTQPNNNEGKIEGLVYSKFLDIGPEVIASFPNLEAKKQSAIALKSLNLFAAEGGRVPESISVIPFTKFGQIGVVKCFEIADENARGGARDATLTILVNENFNNLVLRFIDDLDKLLTHISGRILVNEQVQVNPSELQQIIQESYNYIIENLKIFQAIEQDREKFLDEPKIVQLRKMISEIEHLVEGYVRDVDQFGTDEVKDVLKLAWDLKQIDLYHLTPEDIREIVEVANTLKLKKETITIQKQKLKHYQKQLTKAKIEKLNRQIDKISANLEKFTEKLLEIIKKLTSRSEKVIKNHKKKGKIDFIFHKQFEKLRKNLKQHFNLFREIERLPPEKFQQIKQAYVELDEMRKLRKNREVGKAVDKMAKILGIDRNIILQYTRDTKIKEDFNKIFQLD